MILNNTTSIAIEKMTKSSQVQDEDCTAIKKKKLNNQHNKKLLNVIISKNNYTNGSAYLNSICDYIKYKIKHTKNHQNSIVSIDPSLRKVLIIILLSPFIYKFIQFAVSSSLMERLYDTSYYVRDRFGYSYNWLSEQSGNFNILTPFLFGFVFTVFSWMIVYLDSNTPGINPPSLFSPNSRFRNRQQRKSSMQLSYLTAILGGIVVTGLMLFNSS